LYLPGVAVGEGGGFFGGRWWSRGWRVGAGIWVGGGRLLVVVGWQRLESWWVVVVVVVVVVVIESEVVVVEVIDTLRFGDISKVDL
jgi:hypothetical protein